MDKSTALWIFGAAFTIINTIGAILLKMFDNRLKRVEDKAEQLPNVYARRDDVKDMKQEIIDALQRIEDKIEVRLK